MDSERGEPPVSWDPAQIALLRALWQAGVATAEIGRRLGRNKNSVIGKAHRIGLIPRPSPIVAEGTRRAGRPRGRAAKQTLAPLASTARAVAPPAPGLVPALARCEQGIAVRVADPVPHRPALSLAAPTTIAAGPGTVSVPPLFTYAEGGRGCEWMVKRWKPGMHPAEIKCGRPRRDRRCSYCEVHAAVVFRAPGAALDSLEALE